MAKKTIDRSVFTAFNGKVGRKCTGSHGSTKKMAENLLNNDF